MLFDNFSRHGMVFFTNHVDQEILILLLMSGFGLGSIYILAEYFYTKASYDENGIFFQSPWSGKYNYSWQELKSVAFSEQSQ